MLLCRHHHRFLQEGGYYVVKDGRDLIFCRGDGELIQPRNETSLAAQIARSNGAHCLRSAANGSKSPSIASASTL
jgi:hypothetical protein